MRSSLILAIGLLLWSGPVAAQEQALGQDHGALSLRAFADAALACTDAVQTQVIATAPIVREGWRAYNQAPDIASRATTFSRPPEHVFIIVQNKPPACSAGWFVSTSNSPASLFADLNSEIATKLKQSFGRKVILDTAPSEKGQQLQHYQAGNAVATFIVEQQNPAGILLKFEAINKESLAGLVTNP